MDDFEIPRITLPVGWQAGAVNLQTATQATRRASIILDNQGHLHFKPKPVGLPRGHKEWITKTASSFSDAETKRFGKTPNPKFHLNNLADLKKHEVAALTQLRSNHVHLNQYLNNFKQLSDSACDCQEGVELVEHYLFICVRYDQQRLRLLNQLQQLQIKPNKVILQNPPPGLPTHRPVLQRHLAAQDPLEMGKNQR
ncbi:hypothetical protein CROQUDRAFT_95840 [Cronartium quercuum f. sp. fusiforme G11]|uniref:Uncharacterized protein n=1 Tax=Cronartium quercuum f. sp. fusiforme G11 TaxID=708437 RepID=A0A9P6NGJ1_9BASI|nr:hypothetical protein CROQUDRAFT_95840 [Cronartium quercuum f. sp. fusiforme G11]